MIAVLIWLGPHPEVANHNGGSLTLDGGGAVIIAGVITAIATIIAALIAAKVLLDGYKKQLAITRDQERDRLHAEAIEAVHEYLENPYRIRRRDGSAEARMAVNRHISDVQVRLRYYDTLIRLNSTPEVAAAYAELVATARREAGVAMKEAWASAPTTRDDQVSLSIAYPTPGTSAALTATLAAMTAARSTT